MKDMKRHPYPYLKRNVAFLLLQQMKREETRKQQELLEKKRREEQQEQRRKKEKREEDLKTLHYLIVDWEEALLQMLPNKRKEMWEKLYDKGLRIHPEVVKIRDVDRFGPYKTNIDRIDLSRIPKPPSA